MRINIAEKNILDKILQRKKKDEDRPEEVDLKFMLKEILSWANRFVPSESGSILLDDPVLNQNKEKSGVLYFVACFGKGSVPLLATTLPISIGIAGQTYLTGKPYISKKVKDDRYFYSAIDKKTKFETKSIICAPIRIKGVTIGVIELINRQNGIDYDSNDLTLLKIFAEYTSTLIQNSLDAKRFGELAMKDNLTGLFNDRYFHDRLTVEVAKAVKKKSDLSLIFLDLDRFKEINDTHGHLAGSKVLSEVGGILLESAIDVKGVPIRYGGDEFIIILPGANISSAFEFAERLRNSIEKFVFLKHRFHGGKALKIEGVITASLGIASLKDSLCRNSPPQEVRNALIKAADSAMYRSKQEGKNRASTAPSFTPEMHV